MNSRASEAIDEARRLRAIAREREHAEIERDLCRAFFAVSLPERDHLPTQPQKPRKSCATLPATAI
jgi:hypothetical protein